MAHRSTPSFKRQRVHPRRMEAMNASLHHLCLHADQRKNARTRYSCHFFILYTRKISKILSTRTDPFQKSLLLFADAAVCMRRFSSAKYLRNKGNFCSIYPCTYLVVLRSYWRNPGYTARMLVLFFVKLSVLFPIPLFVYLLALLTPQSGASTGIDLFVCLCVYFFLFPFSLVFSVSWILKRGGSNAE